jgi:flagellar biogenesis protein FliO
MNQQLILVSVMLIWLIAIILVAIWQMDKQTDRDRKWIEKKRNGKTYYYPKKD